MNADIFSLSYTAWTPTTSESERQKELEHRERLLREREVELRLREMETNIHATDAAFHQTVKHQPENSQNKFHPNFISSCKAKK